MNPHISISRLLLLGGMTAITATCSPQDPQPPVQDEVGAESTATEIPGAATEAPPQALAIGPDETHLVYVSNEDSNNLTVISGSTHEVLATIDVGKRPRGMKVSPDGSRVYVALSGSPKCPPAMPDEECEAQERDRSADGIAEVDVMNQRVLRVLESGENPEQFDVNWGAGRLFVSNEDIGMASVLDMESGELIMQAPTGLEPEGVRLSPDGSLVYVTGEVDSDVTVLDVETGEVLASIAVGLRPRDAIFTLDGSTAYVAAEFGRNVSIIDVASHSVTGEIALGEEDLPMEMELSPDESMLYVTTGRAGTILEVDLASGTVTNTVQVGQRPWGMDISPDGRFLYTANGPSDDISVVDRESFEQVATIPVGETPWGVEVAPVPTP